MKLITQALFIIVFISFGKTYGQPMNMMYSNKADSLRNEGNLHDAVNEYHRLYLMNPEDKKLRYNYACALSLFGQNDSCFKYLKLCLPVDTSVSILMDPDFCPVRRDNRWSEIENIAVNQLYIKNKNPFGNLDFARKIWKMSAEDQFGFNEIGIAIRKTGHNSSVVRSIWELKFIIGKNNQMELDALIDKYGWPRIRDVGMEAARAAFTIILHSDSKLINKHIASIKRMCEEKELPWERYATIYDRALWYENKPQKYGTHTQYNEEKGAEELYPLENASRVDEWRSEIGLEPLKDYLIKQNIQYQFPGK
jgi:hypothetical protein